jgi:hypothetical protein
MSVDYTQKSYWLNSYGPYTPNGTRDRVFPA